MPDNFSAWTDKKYSYAGWVPNVHSHLSFSLIGAGRGPEVSTLTRRYNKRLGRFVCTMQRRETDDFLTPMWLTRLWCPQAVQHFILVASTLQVATPIGLSEAKSNALLGGPSLSSQFRLRFPCPLRRPTKVETTQRVATAVDDQGLLRGMMFVLPRQRSAKRRQHQQAWLREFRTHLRSAAQFDDEELDELGRRLALDVSKCSPGYVKLEFALFRTGEVRIWLEDEDSEGIAPTHCREIARQAYFFLKDMVHHHVHHDAKSDQITPLTEIGGSLATQAEELWRRETVWSLSRAVDALARRGKLQDIREASGILAYADAFQKTLLLYRRSADNPLIFEPNPATYRYDFAHIRESLKVQLDQATSRRSSLSQVLIAGMAGCVAATSLLASSISAYNSAGKSDHKADISPVVLGASHGFLDWCAHLFLMPAAVFGALLFIASEQFLSEHRIGVKRYEHRKMAQAVRGAANSIAASLNLSGRAVQRMLQLFYILLLIALFCATGLIAPHVGALSRQFVWLAHRIAAHQR